jgi:hypothetical protein
MQMVAGIFDDINISAKREPGEAFDRYKERMSLAKKAVKRHLRGYIIWPGHHGPAIRKEQK